jgi:hypothetical protein
MRCLKPLPGHLTVSIDLASGEPTVTSHFSRDPNYLYATFDGVNKAPFWKNGVLMIDDIYLMTMSVSPIGRARIEELWRSSFDGLSFAEAWIKDPDIVKRLLKKERDLHKMLALALGYGMGPKKMVKQCYDKGHDLPFKTARDFYTAYWDLYAGIRSLANRLGARIKRDGYIVNPFGYRLTPPPHKGFNYFIQSSVSGIMHVFNWKLFTIAPYASFITVIHDEVLADVPEDRIEDFRKHKTQATDSLNADLKWSVAIRTGFAVGKDWYEAK